MKRAALIGLPLLLMAAQDAPPPAPHATLNVQQGGSRGTDGIYRGGTFTLVDRLDVPAEHGPRDSLIAFEGPGWESDKVAYRLYLDERNVPDIYGKKLPGAVLGRIGQGKDDYHAMADWGMDIFQVNQTLGMGGIGVMRDGKVSQLGPSAIRAQVFNGASVARVEVENRGFAGAGGPADLTTSYAISSGSRVTFVHASVTGAAPQMVAGLTLHPGVHILESTTGKWRYIATWGVQSLAKDELGIALFYPADNVAETGQNNGTFFVRFCNPRRIVYAFAAAWVQEPDAPKSAAAFRQWLDKTASENEHSVRPGADARGCTH
ncbi:MAG: DUF4861 family protein [Pseudomonadota bacterium]